VALYQALRMLVDNRLIGRMPLRDVVAAISVGLVDGELMLDLCYEEDFRAQVDFNLVLTQAGEMVEFQGATEGAPFSRHCVADVLDLAARGMEPLFTAQQDAIASL